MKRVLVFLLALSATSGYHAAAATAHAPHQLAERTLSVDDYNGSAQGLVSVLHQVFGANIILRATDQGTKIRLSLRDATLPQYLSALALQFSPALDVTKRGDMYLLLPAAPSTPSSVVRYLHRVSADTVVAAVNGALAGSNTTATAVKGSLNAVVVTGPAAGVATATSLIDSMDRDAADPLTQASKNVSCSRDVGNGLPTCFVYLTRLSPTEALYSLSKAFPSSLTYSAIPEPEQGGVLLTGASDVLATTTRFLSQLDAQPKRQLTVSINVYDVIPFNHQRSVGVEYLGSTGQASSSSSTTLGTFTRPRLLSSISGIQAQINALDSIGTARLLESPYITIALDDGISDTTQPATGSGSSGQAFGGASSFANAIPTISGAPQSQPGSATIRIGQTNIVTFSANGFQNSFQIGQVNSGITFTVHPTFVGSDGLMRLSIVADVDTINGYVNGIPQLSGKSLSTDAYIRNDQSLQFGGLYADTATSSKTKVPFLSDIPLFGKLFTNTDTTESREQLVFFVTPKVESI